MRPVLQRHMLPHLACTSLGRLACTCTQLREWLADVDPAVWERAAQVHLPPVYPSAKLGTTESVLQQL